MDVKKHLESWMCLSSSTLSLVYKGHDIQGSLVKIMAKIGVISKGEIDKQF